jgi:DNA helicase-2/ATP-dependent DNA helicase PcrA
MTRARDRLFLSDASEQGRPGLARATSRFVLEAGADRVDFLVPPEGAAGPAGARDGRPGPALGPGDRALHPVFGPGTVVEVALQDSAYRIRFDKLATTRSISFDAPLEALDPNRP